MFINDKIIGRQSVLTDTQPKSTGSIIVPAGTTGQRPSAPSVGMIRYNSTTGFGEMYTGTDWAVIGEAPPAVTGVSPATYSGNAGTEFTVTGANFTNDAIIKFITNDGTEYTAQTVTYVDSSTIRATTPQDFTVAQEPLDVKLVQTSGVSTKLDCIDCGGLPSWQTASGNIGTYSYANTTGQSVSITVSATDTDSGDSVSYSVASGSLPSALSLNSSTGVISGILDEPGSSSVTTNFTLRATDLAGNTSDRTFNIIRRWLDGTTSSQASTSAADLYSLTGGTAASGVYWIKPTGYSTAFQTYCLMNSFGGSHWMLMFMVRDSGSSSAFAYDASYWTLLTPTNVSSSNLNYTTNTATDVATEIVSSFPFRYLACSFYGRDANLSTYLLGSATDNASHLMTDYSSVGLTMTKTGAGSDADSVFNYSDSSTSSGSHQGSPANQWRYNQSHTGQNGFSYCRFGQAMRAELYNGAWYSNNGKGLGPKSTLGGGSYAASAGFGFTNARTNSGGSSPSGTINNQSKVEIWVR